MRQIIICFTIVIVLQKNMQSFWCICIRISIIQLKVCKTDRIVYEDTTAELFAIHQQTWSLNRRKVKVAH